MCRTLVSRVLFCGLYLRMHHGQVCLVSGHVKVAYSRMTDPLAS